MVRQHAFDQLLVQAGNTCHEQADIVVPLQVEHHIHRRRGVVGVYDHHRLLLPPVQADRGVDRRHRAPSAPFGADKGNHHETYLTI